MKSLEQINRILEYFKTKHHDSLEINEEAVLASYEKSEGHQTLTIKVLSIFGGILSSLAFVGFIILAELYESSSGMATLGLLLISLALWINSKAKSTILDTLGISLFIIGFICLGVSMAIEHTDFDTFCYVFILLAIVSAGIAQTLIISFVSVLIVSGSLLTLIIESENLEKMHILLCFYAVAITAVFVWESWIVSASPIFARLYKPVKIGLIFSFVAALFMNGKMHWFINNKEPIWRSSVVFVLLIMALVLLVFSVFKINKSSHKIIVVLLLLTALAPTVLAPAISGCMLIILNCFYANYKTGFSIGVLAFIYYVGQYYYDLSFTLLTKSLMLIATGVLFLVLYFLLWKSKNGQQVESQPA